MPSTIRQAASTESSRAKSDWSPFAASPISRWYGGRSFPRWWEAYSSTASPTRASPGFLARAPSEIDMSGERRKRK